MRILLVDDETLFSDAAEHFLSAEPGLVIVGRAASGREAIRLVNELHPDLVLMDLAMSEMNGLEATRYIKTQPNAPRIIILSLHCEDEYREAAKSVGADGFVSKLEFGTELLPLIRSLMTDPVVATEGGKDCGQQGENS